MNWLLNSKVNLKKYIPILKGVSTFIPGAWTLFRRGTGGTDRAEYCYGVWLKHLVLARSTGLLVSVPKRVAEIGPGDSLGVGIAALLSGADEYYALDVVRYSDIERNLKLFDEMVQLFRGRSPRPLKGWPDFDEFLDSRLFPSELLSETVLEECLKDERLEQIRMALRNPGNQAGSILINYAAPWTNKSVMMQSGVDFLLSHSVLEHVVDIDQTYTALAEWLRPGGVMSHQIDFSSHGICEPWNGHRSYGPFAWRMIIGGRPFLINREPPSVHIKYIMSRGFEVITSMMNYGENGLPRSKLAKRWQDFDEPDLQISSCFIQAKRIAT